MFCLIRVLFAERCGAISLVVNLCGTKRNIFMIFSLSWIQKSDTLQCELRMYVEKLTSRMLKGSSDFLLQLSQAASAIEIS